MKSRQEQFSGTRDILEMHQFDPDPLQEYMLSHVEGFHGPLDVRQFRGGQSNPTYLLESPSGKYVLRRKPPGKLLKSAHAVDREYRVISALYAADFPVPRPYVLCKDEEIVGTMFFIMEFVEGRIFWDLDLPDSDPGERRAIYEHANQIIADLHNFDFEQIGLSDFGKPGNYFTRQISRWSKQYAASETSKITAMNKLIEWLPGNIPDDESATVVHGDYRLDNMIIHPTEPRIIAVLDWELSTIGHPLGDFTYHLMAWQMPEIGIGSRKPGGMMASQTVIFIPLIIYFELRRSCRVLPAVSGMVRRQAYTPSAQLMRWRRLPHSVGSTHRTRDFFTIRYFIKASASILTMTTADSRLS